MRIAASFVATDLPSHHIVEMTSWLRILLLDIAFVQFGRCQTDIDDDDEDELDEDEPDEDEPDEDDELSSILPPAPTSVPAASSLPPVLLTVPMTMPSSGAEMAPFA